MWRCLWFFVVKTKGQTQKSGRTKVVNWLGSARLEIGQILQTDFCGHVSYSSIDIAMVTNLVIHSWLQIRIGIWIILEEAWAMRILIIVQKNRVDRSNSFWVWQTKIPKCTTLNRDISNGDRSQLKYYQRSLLQVPASTGSLRLNKHYSDSVEVDIEHWQMRIHLCRKNIIDDQLQT